jgi:hypothetical protein
MIPINGYLCMSMQGALTILNKLFHLGLQVYGKRSADSVPQTLLVPPAEDARGGLAHSIPSGRKPRAKVISALSYRGVPRTRCQSKPGLAASGGAGGGATDSVL